MAWNAGRSDLIVEIDAGATRTIWETIDPAVYDFVKSHEIRPKCVR